MNAERREQVEAVCATALEREGDERARFVEEACRGDSELRALVDWLLASRLALSRPRSSSARVSPGCCCGRQVCGRRPWSPRSRLFRPTS